MMKICDTCGNEIADVVSVCPFCEHAVAVTFRREPVVRVRTINIESGMPTVEEGRGRLERKLDDARQRGVRVVRVIHGWGSSGKGGQLRSACRALLHRELKAKRLRAVVHGENYSRTTGAGRELMARYSELRRSERTDAKNPGITMVEL